MNLGLRKDQSCTRAHLDGAPHRLDHAQQNADEALDKPNLTRLRAFV